MLTVRVIPCLDVEDGRVVKGVRFKNLRDAGDPVERAELYDFQGADELIFLDVAATPRSRETMVGVVEAVSRRVFVPLTVGGGIRSLDDMRRMLRSGADKVAICTAALKRPELIAECAGTFGSQCVVLSIDALRSREGWHACSGGGREDTGRDALEWAKRAVELGAGEILLNSIDRDGTGSGYDLDLTRRVSESVPVPVIASGGAGTRSQVLDAVRRGKADAVLLASMFHDGVCGVSELKNYLKAEGVEVR
jgi:cyclase